MIKFLKFDLKKREMNVGVVNFLLITFFRLIAFWLGFGILCFLILEFIFPGNKVHRDLLENYPLLISSVIAVSAYLIAKLIEKFCFIYRSEKRLKFIAKNLIIGNPVKVLVLVISIFWLSVIEYLNFTGYCHKEERYLSEQELVDRVIKKKFVNTLYNAHSVQDFKEKNPDCCHIKYDSWYTESPFWYFVGRIFNSYYLLGLDIYAIKELDDEQLRYGVNSYSVTSCGEPYFVEGMTLNKEEYSSKKY